MPFANMSFTNIPHLPPARLARLLCEADALLVNYQHGYQPTVVAQAFLAQHRGDVAAAVVAKVGSHNFCKRRPAHGTADYASYVAKQLAAQQPLHFRVGFGPLKNMQRFGDCQRADVAEYLTFAQLARVALAINALYPHGVCMTVVPDNLRAEYANHISADCVADYIGSLQDMAQSMGLDSWLTVTDGQQGLYNQYQVIDYFAAAEESLLAEQHYDTAAFAQKMTTASGNAAKNIAGCHTCSADDAAGAAWRYLVAHEAEVLAGLWAVRDTFPLQYARRASFFQMFTMYKEETAMPWQILLPLPTEVRQAA